MARGSQFGTRLMSHHYTSSKLISCWGIWCYRSFSELYIAHTRNNNEIVGISFNIRCRVIDKKGNYRFRKLSWKNSVQISFKINFTFKQSMTSFKGALHHIYTGYTLLRRVFPPSYKPKLTFVLDVLLIILSASS